MMIGYSLSNEDGINFIQSFNDVLVTIKTEQIKPLIYMPNIAQESTLNPEMQLAVTREINQLIDASNQSNYFKKMKNAITSHLLRIILKFINRKQ